MAKRSGSLKGDEMQEEVKGKSVEERWQLIQNLLGYEWKQIFTGDSH